LNDHDNAGVFGSAAILSMLPIRSRHIRVRDFLDFVLRYTDDASIGKLDEEAVTRIDCRTPLPHYFADLSAVTAGLLIFRVCYLDPMHGASGCRISAA
jgi:hypothetical protein